LHLDAMIRGSLIGEAPHLSTVSAGYIRLDYRTSLDSWAKLNLRLDILVA